MRDEDNIRNVEQLGIDIMGFIFFSKSKRYFLNGGKKESLPKRCKKAGVFVDENINILLQIANNMDLDYIQLHGNESPEECYIIKDKGFKVIKAFHIQNKADIESISKEYEKNCDMFLFDTKCNEFGGSGKQFDWNILDSYSGETPFLLSGGIDKDSAITIKNIDNPLLHGVDLNSKFEVSPAYKDINLLRQFINELKNYEL